MFGLAMRLVLFPERLVYSREEGGGVSPFLSDTIAVWPRCPGLCPSPLCSQIYFSFHIPAAEIRSCTPSRVAETRRHG